MTYRGPPKPQRRRASNLAKPTLPTGLNRRLEGARSLNGEDAVLAMLTEIEHYSGATRAYTISRKYKYAAIGKAMEFWFVVEGLPKWERSEIYKKLAVGQKIGVRTDGLHVLLKRLIHYPEDQRSATRTMGRDAAAIKQMARLGWKPEEVVDRMNGEGIGLDHLAREEAKTRKAERGQNCAPAAASKSTAGGNSTGPSSAETGVDKTVEVAAVEDSGHVTVAWRKGLKARLLSRSKRTNYVMLLAVIDPHTRRLVIQDGSLTSHPVLSEVDKVDMFKLLRGSGLITSPSIKGR